MGIEVYYSSHSQSDSLHLREIASRLGLVSTGGSDFHGANKPDIHLGSGYGGLRVSALPAGQHKSPVTAEKQLKC